MCDAVVESSQKQRSYRESEQPTGNYFSQNFRRYIILELPPDQQGHTFWFTIYLFSITHDLHPRISGFPVVT